jgi:hypothetical protein
MTDELTDAVRRLKGLQEDIERLQSGQDEEGEPRLLFSSEEDAVASENTAISAGPRVDDTGAYNSASYNTHTYNDTGDADTRRRRRIV